MTETETESTTFESLGLSKSLLDAVKKLGYREPTPIQQQCIPPALDGQDIIGLAPTGETAAISKLWDASQRLFACLTHQIATQFEALGAGMGVRCAVIVGGDLDRVAQGVALAKGPHILLATPADRVLNLDFGTHLDDLLKAMPKQRTTNLFSATMTNEVSKHHTVPTLLQYYVLYPLIHKEALLVYLVNSLLSNSMIVLARTVHDAQRIRIILRTLSFNVDPLHGDLTCSQRMGALAKFRSGDSNILVATDIASCGLDIPPVDLVINFDAPGHSKDYIHRVGRTARAGRVGKTIMMVTQYDVELLQRPECLLEKKLEEWPTDKEDVLVMTTATRRLCRRRCSHYLIG
ncbi:P-loop containing nucleoside triphosphate hydrolase protein [Armillaria mellea]|nr:P-loop containing nucleoside triphosphate hydrolase protein [Armillaria mellea]